MIKQESGGTAKSLAQQAAVAAAHAIKMAGVGASKKEVAKAAGEQAPSATIGPVPCNYATMQLCNYWLALSCRSLYVDPLTTTLQAKQRLTY